ncbi:alpha-amylase [Streptococcus sp. UBA4344]|uniref:alpha-amylase n=1 Tax=Streptococcus sp. UBA4344 TaxID=1947564 RepID=UPI002579F942|nr:alpha-amylase [Streptococcus sp. UBA4344]
MINETLMQYFEWYLPNDGKHWKRLAADAPTLAKKGITKIWMPPAFKATHDGDVGYGVYDLFDLGEFDQKGTIRTKYGTKVEYLDAIAALKNNGIKALADVILNHKAAADHTETFNVVEVAPDDRTKVISQPFEIEGWTNFTFDGRNHTYNDFEWHWYHFTGTDYDVKTGKNGIFQIQGDNKGWANQDLVDGENGNYDYLMYADLDFKHPEVIQNIYDWADWFLKTTGVSGFRLDAIKHIDSFFMGNFIRDMKAKYGDDFYVFGEFWNGDEKSNNDYLESTDYRFDLVDVRLHQNLFEASQAKENYDLRHIFNQTLVKNHPHSAVTFVDNHDTQRGQALESTVEEWFKPVAYALILLRQTGLPCVFYGDYYGISGQFAQESFQNQIDKLLELRQTTVYGQETDYFDQANCIGWTCLGDDEHPTALAVLISNSKAQSKRMFVGKKWADQLFTDALDNQTAQVLIDKEGYGDFLVAEKSVSAWIPLER